MKTVSSLCASGSVTALSAIGLAVARRETHVESSERAERASPDEDMTTAVASYPLVTTLDAPSFHLHASRRLASDGQHHVRVRPRSRNNTAAAAAVYTDVTHKRRSTPVASLSAGMDRATNKDEERSGLTGTSNTRPTWYRRLSSSMSPSRDSSRTPSSRPASAAYTNGSLAVSHTGSVTPMFPDTPPAALPPNKLVKRTASLHSSTGSSSPTSGSRLPLPTFRRPATSHQRSATLQERFSSTPEARVIADGDAPGARDLQWRHYFTGRVAADRTPSARRRGSTGIPNPIRRVYPDRRYTPTLVTAKDLAQPIAVDLDDGEVSDADDCVVAVSQPMAPSTASSPFPTAAAFFDEETAPRRSFSIGDLLSTGPEPLWKRPTSSKARPWSSRSLRKGRPRVTSEPQVPMGNSFSGTARYDAERPAKRRDLTDPQASQRSIYSSASSHNAATTERGLEVDLNLSTGAPSLQVTPDHSLYVESLPRAQTPLSSEQFQSTSTVAHLSSAKPNRLSTAPSEITSTIGSDNSGYQSIGDDSTDYQSETAYDSIQTRTTRSSSGRRGPHIETIFDNPDSPPTFSSGKSTKLRDFLSDGYFGEDHNGRYRHSTIEEEESVVSTPVRSIRNKSLASTPSVRPVVPQYLSSSPPMMVTEPDDIDWEMGDDHSAHRVDVQPRSNASSLTDISLEQHLPFRFGPSLRPGNPPSIHSTPRKHESSPHDRTNLFDWAEQQPSPCHPNSSPQRPRTVHGKKDQDSRGSRPSGRRPTSGMHARSHSVPVVPDLDGKRNNVVANKFGTWGVGSKAVTEDWNEDFDFEEPPLPFHMAIEQDEKRIDSGHEMFVPKSIREQQENVVANIGLLREWGLLIEELKELRVRAVTLDMFNGPYAQAWREVDAMIELADQESEEHTLEPRRSPPSSPGFDYTAFEDTPSSKARPRQSSGTLFENRDGGDSGSPRRPAMAHTSTQNPDIATRPRKDSELVAQHVIAALQSRRSASDPSILQAGSKKVPFDTATLRHIVPYVNSLKRKVKDALRETEGLYSSPHRRASPSSRKRRERLSEEADGRTNPNDPQAGDDVMIRQQVRREEAAPDHNGSGLTLLDQDGALVTRMQKLTFTL